MRGLPALVLLLLVPLLCPAAASAEAPREVDNGWEYRLGRSPVGADGVPGWAGDTEAQLWLPMPARGALPMDGALSEVWLRMPLPTGDWKAPALLAGSFMGVIEVWVGGRRVYMKGSPAADGATAGMDDLAALWHLVPLERGDLGQRATVRLIRVTPATLERTVRVGDRDQLVAEVVTRGIPAFVVGCLQLLAALVALGAGLLGGRNRSLLALAAFAFTSGLVLVGANDLMVLFTDHPMRGLYLVLVAFVANAPALVAFTREAILTRPSRWLTWVFRVSLATAVTYSFCVALVPSAITPGIAIVAPVTTAAIFSCLIASFLEARQGNGDAKVFLGGVAFLFAVSFMSSIGNLVRNDGSTDASNSLFHWGVLGLVSALAGVLVRRARASSEVLHATVRGLEERRGRLGALAAELEAAAAKLLDAVEQLRGAGRLQHASIMGQATSIQQLAATSAEIHQVSRVAAEKAQATLQASQSAEDLGRTAADSADLTRSSLEAIRVEVGDMASRIGALEQQVGQVAGIVATVKDLADQSNMLALNAAIEAVRAGETGRGFALVAKEVRALADQSLEATTRIRGLLDTLRESTREAADLSSQGATRIGESLGRVQAFGDSVRSLASLIREASGSVRLVSSAIGQQSVGAGELAVAARALTEAAAETSTRQVEADAVTESVGGVAGDIRRLAATAAQAAAANV